jgi:ATP-dependent helicase/nuclease subunit A
MTNESINPQVLSSTMIFSDSEFEENSVCSETSNTENVDEETIRSLSDDYISKFNFVYPYDKVRKIPAKLSVSRLYPSLLDEYDTAFDTETITNAKIRTPQFIKSSGRSGCDVGTATHLFMQFCSFENLRINGVQNELKRLNEKGFIDDSTASLVSTKAISRFLSSETMKSLLKAKEIHRELRFNVTLDAYAFTSDSDRAEELKGESIFVQGIIDCLYVDENDKQTVLDYKTDIIDKDLSHEEAREYIIERHLQQLSYYYAAAKIITGKDIDRVVLYSFSLGEEIEIPKSRLTQV